MKNPFYQRVLRFWSSFKEFPVLRTLILIQHLPSTASSLSPKVVTQKERQKGWRVSQASRALLVSLTVLLGIKGVWRMSVHDAMRPSCRRFSGLSIYSGSRVECSYFLIKTTPKDKYLEKYWRSYKLRNKKENKCSGISLPSVISSKRFLIFSFIIASLFFLLLGFT